MWESIYFLIITLTEFDICQVTSFNILPSLPLMSVLTIIYPSVMFALICLLGLGLCLHYLKEDFERMIKLNADVTYCTRTCSWYELTLRGVYH